MKKKLLPSLLTALFALCCTLAICIPLATTEVEAIDATAVTLTATDGTQTILTEDVETATYSWEAETARLTLRGYSGQMIQTNGNIRLHLVGTNTLTMDPTVTGRGLYALNLDYAGGSAEITADVGGRLNIRGEDLQTHFSAVSGAIVLVNGTVDIDVSTSGAGFLYGFERSVSFAYSGDAYENAPSKDAVINLNIERTSDANSLVYGFYNGLTACYRGDVTVNATVAGSTNDTVYGFTDLAIYEASPQITMTVTNGSGSLSGRRALDACQGIALTEGGRVELNGRIRVSAPPTSANVHTVTSSPDGNGYLWLDVDGKPNAADDFLMADLEETPLESAVFVYSETPAELDWLGDGHLSLPSAKVDEELTIELLAAVRGASYYGASTHAWGFEIVEGQLPSGLTIGTGGRISGKLTAPCEAGSVRIRITDRNQTQYDEGDDRSIEVTVPYGACLERDRYLTVDGDDPIEMRSNGSGDGWSYDAASKTLTLSGYDGTTVSTEFPLRLHLDGENTITLTDEHTEGLVAVGSVGEFTVSAEDGGTLYIVSDGLTRSFAAVHSALYLENGTVDINVSSTFENGAEGYGIQGYFSAVSGVTEQAVWRVTLRDTSPSGRGALFGNKSNGVNISDRDSLTFTVDLEGSGATRLLGISSLNLYKSSATVTVTVDNAGGSGSCVALDGLQSLVLTEGGRLDLTGGIASYSLPSSVSPHTVSTTPASDGYLWLDTNPHYYYESFVMSDLAGEPLSRAVFEYSEEPAALKWTGDGQIAFPGGTVGDYVGMNLWSGLRGASSYNWGSTNWRFEIIEGALPTGLMLDSYNAKFGSAVTVPCVAGSVRIRATDLAGTYDTADDRSVEFSLPYGAFLSNKPVTGLTLGGSELVLDNGGTGEVIATVTPSDAAYANVLGSVIDGDGDLWIVEISDPVSGVSRLTVRASTEAGKWTLSVKTVELGLTQSLTVYVREQTPSVTLSYMSGRLSGLRLGESYRISGENVTPTTFTAEHSEYEIPEEWFGKTLQIVLLNEGEEKCSSLAQSLEIPARPDAPLGVGKTDASDSASTDGSITGVDGTMQYRSESSQNWLYVNGDSVLGLAAGTYYVRYAPTYEAFASETVTVVIGYGELTFTDSPSLDVPGGQTDTVKTVELAPSVSGGKKPYVWSVEGPAWVTVDQGGRLTVARPSEEQAATSVTVTVTDASAEARSVTIAIGAVTAPHVCVFDQQVIADNYRKRPADCTGSAVYYYSCLCGETNGTAFTYGEPLGHDFTEKIEDAAHLRQAGAECLASNIYWYDCSRCALISDTESYAGETVVAHTLVYRAESSPSCTETGHIGYYACTGSCGKYFSDANGTEEIADQASVILPALGHDYTEKIEDEAHLKQAGADCMTKHIYWYDCSRCAASAKDDPEAGSAEYAGAAFGAHLYGTLIPAVGEVHTKTELSPSVAAHYRCSACDRYFTAEKQESTLAALTGATPTHTLGAWTPDPSSVGSHYRACACGKTETAACTYGAGVETVPPSYASDGTMTFTCSTCGGKRTEPIERLEKTDELVSGEGGEIKVSIPDGSEAILDASAILSAEKLEQEPDDQLKSNLRSSLGGKARLLATYEISILLDGTAVQPGGTVAVTLPAPENAGKYRSITVAYVSDSGEVTPLETTVHEDGSITFLTDHFSRYIIVGTRKTGLPVGAIVAIVLSGVALLAVGAFAIVYFAVKKHSFADLAESIRTLLGKLRSLFSRKKKQ